MTLAPSGKPYVLSDTCGKGRHSAQHSSSAAATQVLHHAELNLPDSEGFDGTLSVAYGAELPLADNKRPRRREKAYDGQH